MLPSGYSDLERRRCLINKYNNRPPFRQLKQKSPRSAVCKVKSPRQLHRSPRQNHQPSEVIISVKNEKIQQRPSSVPSSEKNLTKKCKNPREILELFNPNYEQKKTGGSIIQSIREKVFRVSPSTSQDSWKEVNFPRETRNAIPLQYEKLKRDEKKKVTVEVQTSPKISTTRIYPAFKIPGNLKKMPCPKNLLCEKGLHSGQCARRVFQKQRVAFRAGCPLLESISNTTTTTEENFVVKITETAAMQGLNAMNIMNGHSNGELNGCGDLLTQNQQKGCWTIGLINSKYRYLTAETFGFKINANGASLKKKQMWTLEPDTSNLGDSLIYLRSHLDKYLAVDSFGNITCESEEKEPGCKFQISVAEDNSGRWALKNVVRGYFLGSGADKLTCTAKVPGEAEFWHVHLAARPQMNLRSVGRKRFAHLSENLDEIHVDANVPWGEDTLFTLEFRPEENGKYAIHTCNNKYLSLGGKLVDTCNQDCLFSAEYHSGQLALRDRTGAYLSPIGSKAVLKTRSQTVTKDELFSLEDSLPQASFMALLNNKFVSVKQGVDVTANQDEISDHETFQLEFDWNTKRWYIRTMQDKYWTLETGGGIQAAGDKRSSNALFDLLWQNDGSVAFRANSGRYVITKRSGHLYATSDATDETCKYYFYLVNRPILVLKCEQGFVGYKSASSPKLECNKATYETIQVERGEKGMVYFKGQNGKYWHVDSEGVTCDSDTPEGFYLELREPTRLCIKTASGNYLTASKNGCFRLGDTSVDSATQWEY